MTAYQVRIGSQAQADITDIMRYIGQILLEPRTAGNLYGLLKEEILGLGQMPERYPYEDDDRLRALGIRKLLVKNYKVLYFAMKSPPAESVAKHPAVFRHAGELERAVYQAETAGGSGSQPRAWSRFK